MARPANSLVANFAPVQAPASVPADVREVLDGMQRQLEAAITSLAEKGAFTTVVPPKPRAGDFRLADGTQWNPGFGEGVYRYTVAGAWALIGRTPVRTVATLPAAALHEGAVAYVTDASATTRHSIVAGGGANKVLVFSDATNWLIV